MNPKEITVGHVAWSPDYQTLTDVPKCPVCGGPIIACHCVIERRGELPWTSPFPTGTESSVCEDIAERQRKGIAKYGKTVEDNPLALRQWLQHAYEETLDQAIYLKRAIEEIEKGETK